ncbi:MAG: iron-containing alcohol dehydrogenase [Chitinophagaceae bacterium]|nr:iron-containing alcohol dehydrogenase [Anaerolineae bacterium]
MTTLWNLPRIDIQSLSSVKESRPTALLTGNRSWASVGPLLEELPLIVQAEPHSTDRKFMDSLAEGLPPQVEVIYGVGGGLVSDISKYIGWKRNLPVVIIPTALSVDGFFTPLVGVREKGGMQYETTGPAERVIIDWQIVSQAPTYIRGTGIAEILSIVTGLLDWRYAAEHNQNPPEERFLPWAAGLAAGIAQQAFKIAKGVGEGRIESLEELVNLMCIEVQLNNQLGHTRSQEGSEQYFAQAIESRVSRTRGIPYADLVGPGILISAALHGQDIAPIRATLTSAGVRLGELSPNAIVETVRMLPQYVKQHNLPYSILHDLDLSSERAIELLSKTGLDVTGVRPL